MRLPNIGVPFPHMLRFASFSDLLWLSKPRITLLGVLSAALGYGVALHVPTAAQLPRGEFSVSTFSMLLLGTILLGAGVHALNHHQERVTDRLMHRTRNRPLASGRMRARPVWWGGMSLILLACAVLAVGVNTSAALLGFAVAVLYLGAYTPLKRVSALNTPVGAIPGALPPLLGWVAASDLPQLGLSGGVSLAQVFGLDPFAEGAWFLFGFMFLWQHAHFWPIAWLYRVDYAHAGLVMMPLSDVSGRNLRWLTPLAAILLCAWSFFPFWSGFAGVRYLIGSIPLGAALCFGALAMAWRLDDRSARLALRVSVLYLPLMLGLLLWDVMAC